MFIFIFCFFPVGCETGTETHHPHGFHFNAIYTGVASVVGVACVGAIVVITLCRAHMKRESSRRRRMHYSNIALRSPTNVLELGQGEGHMAIPNPPWRHRIPLQSHSPNLENISPERNILPHRCRGQTDLTVGGNLEVSHDGVPLIAESIVKPPPYSERGPPPTMEEDEPPPPYTTLPYNNTTTDLDRNDLEEISHRDQDKTREIIHGSVNT